jgi:hypothetical protein
MAFPRLAGTRSVKPVSTEAVSVQDAVRAVVQQGERTKALERIEQFVQRGDTRGVGRDGRLITADLQLLAVQGLLPEDPERSTRAKRLAALPNDYGVSMPSPQRLFVMGELRRMMPKIEQRRIIPVTENDLFTEWATARSVAIKRRNRYQGCSPSASAGRSSVTVRSRIHEHGYSLSRRSRSP